MNKTQKKSKKWMIILGIVASLVVAFILLGQNMANNRASSAQTTVISKGKIELVSISTGKIASADEDSIKLSGSISDLFVELGDEVKKGDVLGEYAKTSATALDLYAPRSGVITKVASQLDNRFEIADTKMLAMDVLVSERLINKVSVGQYAEVYVEAIDQTFYGSVQSKSASADLTGNYTLALEFNNTASNVLVGMRAVAKLNISDYGDYYYHGSISFGNVSEVEVMGTLLSSNVSVGDTVTRNQVLGSYQARAINAQIIASKDGVISSLPSTLASELVISNPKALKLVVNIAETDIHKLAVGQSASIYVEAVDGSFDGEIVDISQVGNINLDYTTYPVTIEFDGKDAPLFLGMSGSAQIVVSSKADILTIPYEALISEGTDRYVLSAEWLENPSAPQSDYYVPVTTGIADNFTIEVIGDNLDGLEIVIPETSSGFGFFPGQQ